MKNEELRVKNSAATVGLCKFLCASLFFVFYSSFFTSLRAQDVETQPAASSLHVKVADGVEIEMVRVEGGEFSMGCNSVPKGVKLNYALSRPEHRVTVDSYWIGRYEVTQGLWKAVMGDNPSKFKGDSLPVECVSWEDAQRFVLMLSQKTGKRFRLPREAEWEYAARGGCKVKGGDYPFAGCDRNQLDGYCWYCVNSGNGTHKVGSLKPNGLGLYDMSGNVAEWCEDWVAEYEEGEQRNPGGPREGENRVLRGGHYGSTSAACTVYDRGWYIPSGKYEFYGLRVVMEVGE